MTRARYLRTADRDLCEVYFAPRDDDHYLVPQRRRRRERAEEAEHRAAGKDRHGFPRPEALGLTPDVLQRLGAMNPRIPMSYTVMFVQVLANRGLSFEEIVKRYEAKAKAGLN